VTVTSALAEEGKSTTAANLATSLARQGKRVVLVDANLRWPSLQHAGDDTAPGFSELLINPALVPQHALRRTSERGLYLLPSGATPSGSDTVMRSSRLYVILTALKGVADLVILDAPPILEGVEASLLAKASDATLIVVDAQKSRRRSLSRALKLLTKAGILPAGALLNRAGHVVPAPAVPALDLSPPTVWADAQLATTEGAEDTIVTDLDTAPESTTSPRLRLVQPYERPLLPFGANAAPAQTMVQPAPEEDPLEITVDELLVDLEKTLALIRELKERHAVPRDA
jgi:capsular exopolysaccharide synthesis family protein